MGEVPSATTESVSPNYFQTMHVPLLQGREFSESDNADSPNVAIISQALVQRYWPAENPLGKRIKMVGTDSKHNWAEIIGVAGEVKYNWISSAQEPTIYFPYRQHPVDVLAIRAAHVRRSEFIHQRGAQPDCQRRSRTADFRCEAACTR